MDSRHSKQAAAKEVSHVFALLADLAEAARRADWPRTQELTAAVLENPVPERPEDLVAYLDKLQRALTTARISRTFAANSLARLNAAASFSAAQMG